MIIPKHKAFVKMLRKLPDDIKQPIWNALEDGADEVIDYAKSIVPVDEGDLKDSFEKNRYSKTKTASFGVEWKVTDFKGHFVEFGVDGGEKYIQRRGRKGKKFRKRITWGEQYAQPFFWPAYRVIKPRIKRRVGVAMKKALHKNWKI